MERADQRNIPYWKELPGELLEADLDRLQPRILKPGNRRYRLVPGEHLVVVRGGALLFRDDRLDRVLEPGDHHITEDRDELHVIEELEVLRAPVMHEGVEAIRAELAYVHVQTLIVEKQRRRLGEGRRRQQRKA